MNPIMNHLEINETNDRKKRKKNEKVALIASM